VISYQSFISKKLNESYDNLIEKLTELKGNATQNYVLISECELKLHEINDLKINAILSKNPNFAQLNSERITPFFLKMARGSSQVNSMWEICDDEGKKFNSIGEQKTYIRNFFANSFKKPENEPANLEGCIETFLGPEILDHPLTRILKLSDDERIRLEADLTADELDISLDGANCKSASGIDGISTSFIKRFKLRLKALLTGSRQELRRVLLSTGIYKKFL
jgi:hypothetical protein